MTKFHIGILIGMFLGLLISFVVFGLCQIAKKENPLNRREQRRHHNPTDSSAWLRHGTDTGRCEAVPPKAGIRHTMPGYPRRSGKQILRSGGKISGLLE